MRYKKHQFNTRAYGVSVSRDQNIPEKQSNQAYTVFNEYFLESQECQDAFTFFFNGVTDIEKDLFAK